MSFLGKWCYSIDEESFEGHFDSRLAAQGEAECQLDGEYVENGEVRNYWVGECCHPLDKIVTSVGTGDLGFRVAEQVDEWLYDYISSDEQIIDIDKEDAIELGQLIFRFLSEKAHVSMYGVSNITKHEYIIGSNE